MLASRVQDENLFSSFSKRVPVFDAENSVPASASKQARPTPLGKAAGLSTQRRVLGNITNRSFGPAGDTPAKGTASGLKQRKPLGNITNATPVSKQEQQASFKSKQPVAGNTAACCEQYA